MDFLSEKLLGAIGMAAWLAALWYFSRDQSRDPSAPRSFGWRIACSLGMMFYFGGEPVILAGMIGLWAGYLLDHYFPLSGSSAKAGARESD